MPIVSRSVALFALLSVAHYPHGSDCHADWSFGEDGVVVHCGASGFDDRSKARTVPP